MDQQKTTLQGGIALLGPDSVPSDGPVDIVIDGRRIVAIRPTGEAAPDGRVIDLRGRLVTPGLINGHQHSHEHYQKAFFRDNLPLEPWMNYTRPLKPLQLTPRQVYLRTMIGAIEAVRSGTTTMNDDFNVSPVLIPEHVEAAYQAYDDIGMRANLGMTLFDKPFFRAVPFVDEEFPPALLEEYAAVKPTPPGEVLDYARKQARERHWRENRVACIAAPSAPQRCTADFLLEVRDMADSFELPVMIHVQETRVQVVTGQLDHRSTMVEYLHELGFMKPRTQFIHAIWLNPRDLELIAETGISLQHNPTVNLMVGSGLMPVREVLDAGINLSMGTDGCGSIETCDMQKALFTGALLQKLRGWDYTRWVGATEIWRAATMGGAVALGRGDELGAIEPGRRADLSVYRLDGIQLTPLNDPVRQLVYGETGRDLEAVFVDGDTIMLDGKLTRVDEAALIAEIQEAHRELLPQLVASRAEVEKMVEPMERIYRRCQEIPIAEDTFPTRVPY